jgi:predicted nucleotidyltransferase
LKFPNLGCIFPNMGAIEADHVSPSNALFSNVQQRVLALIFGNPDRSFYTAEILRRVKSGTGAVERELSRLRRSGLVSVERIGNQKHYRANHESPVYRELQGLVLKTVGLVEPLAEALKPYAANINAAFVFGSVAKGTHHAGSDIDLMVIGDDLNYADLYVSLQRAESKLYRPIKPLFLSLNDWRRKLAETESFVQKINGQPKILIIGSEREIAS